MTIDEILSAPKHITRRKKSLLSRISAIGEQIFRLNVISFHIR